MSQGSLRIFVVDDDPVAREITADLLGELGHAIEQVASGKDLLANLDDPPDMILLDVEMPEMDGISACRQLREQVGDRTLVMFVSAHDDLDTRLSAYRAGGDDFVVKPYLPDELVEKVRVAEKALDDRRQASRQAQFAQQTAFTAMSSMGEMGVVLQCLRASFNCPDAAALAHVLFDALGQYGLTALIEFRSAAGDRCFAPQGDCSPLEVSILSHARGLDRIFQFRDRLAINYDKITLLVLNLPVDDPERVGRLRDHLAVLIEAAEARLVAVEDQARLAEQSHGIVRIMTEVGNVLADIDSRQAADRVRSIELTSSYLQDLTNAFVRLGLSEDQERVLTDMAQETFGKLEALLDEGHSVGERLRSVSLQLQRLSGREG